MLLGCNSTKMYRWIKEMVLNIKARLQENSLDSAIWLVDTVPALAGFSILKDKVGVFFWILHVMLLVYIYVVGTVEYQMKHAECAGDFIKGYINVSLAILTLNNSYWFVMKRPLLGVVLSMVKQNDELSRESESLREKHRRYIAVVKKIVFIFYILNFSDTLCIYMPNQINPTKNQYFMTPCVGIQPLSAFPQYQICLAILIVQHITMGIVVLSFQAILIFIIAHTTAMYHLLSEDMVFETKEDFRNTDIVKEKLPVLIRRHAAILKTIDRIKALYSMPLGVNFGTNAICILVFFCVPLQDWVNYSPVLIYCFSVFFLYCFLSQNLINSAEVFERAVYSCGWERFNVKDQKLVYVMLMQAQKPILLLAADIIPVNMYTFSTTLLAIYKFVTVVKM